ncbi:type IV pilin protein [Thalassotalea maritima]|uniref:type IV pilin protein n=1 Tax=Thalassotalea maritima TaxID=3242416 RepID=UPI0035286CE0
MHANRRASGFTLIEVLIVVAIIGILAAIATPSYTEYVTRTNRSEAMTELVRLASLQEQYYSDMRTYAADLTKLGASANPMITNSGLYSIAATASAASFTLKATALGTQASKDSVCKELMINDVGVRTATSTNCWER